MKGGFEYRNIESQFQFLGSTEITYNSITDFIDNRPAAVQVALDSPVFTPQQYYLIGSCRTRGARRIADARPWASYDFYSVVKEKDGLARPFFVEDNAFSTDPDNFYNPDKNNFSPRCRQRMQSIPKTALRAGFGLFYGLASSKIASSPSRTTSSAASRLQTSRATAWRARSIRDLPQSALRTRLYPRPARRVQHAVRRERVS